MKHPKIKIVFFDMDGVLFDVGYFEHREKVGASSWKLVAEAADTLEEEERLKERWINGELKHFIEWMDETVKLYRKHNLTREKFEKTLDSIPLMPGAREAVAEIKRKGYITAVITGSFHHLARRAKLELGIDYIVAACDLIFDKKGKLIDWIFFPCDYEGKVKFFEAIIAGLHLKREEAAMVCDGVNDIPIAKECGLPIAFNARQELKEHCDVIIGKKDLREILKHL
ncbi:HAD family phosphatase [Candidatus Woesearchaeota archaeon]|nr:HAD family phosphatase [Candidatus Woesearchaeota archaeon]